MLRLAVVFSRTDPFIAGAALFPADMREPCFAYTDRRGSRRKGHLLTSRRQLEPYLRQAIEQYLRRIAVSYAFLTRACLAEYPVEDVALLAISRAVERLHHLQPNDHRESLVLEIERNSRIPVDKLTALGKITVVDPGWVSAASRFLVSCVQERFTA
jgi:hypothetical protein